MVAEGVETKEQFDFLRKLGCDQIQGYYFSKPIPSSEVVKLLYKTMTREAAAAAPVPGAEPTPVVREGAGTGG